MSSRFTPALPSPRRPAFNDLSPDPTTVLFAPCSWELVTVLPSFVMGPTVEPCAGSEDVQFFVRLSKGELWPLAPDSGMGMVDVRDVAAAHCLAMVAGQARGRWVWVNEGVG